MTHYRLKTLLPILILSLILTSCSAGRSFMKLFESDYKVSFAEKGVYGENCGECHFAYQTQLLPEKSWTRMMKAGELEDHFGEYLEFDSDINSQLLAYLLSDPGNKTEFLMGQKIDSSISPGSAPLRITETEFYKDIHSDIDKEKYVTNNEEVRSFSNCNACHETADEGNFHERNVSVPNFDD